MRECPVVRAFDAVVNAGPERPAIVLPGRVVSFAELDGRANSVARLVRTLPGGRRDPVVLSIADPVAMVAAQLGTLRAGRPYAVVNPNFPAARQQAMRGLLRAAAVLRDHPAADDPAAVAVPDGLSPPWRSREVGPSDLAYVLFTSGSTGDPKGVAQTRGDMAQNVRRHAPFRISPADRITLITADGVISAVSNLYIGLLRGAAIVPYAFHQDGADDMLGWLGACGVTVFYAFPSFLRQLASAAPAGSVPGVRLAYLGGEPVHSADFEALGRLFPAAVRATGLNSTETGLTRLFRLPAGAPVPATIPLGGPVDGVDVSVNDDGRIVVRSPFVKPRLWLRGGLTDLVTLAADGRAELVTGDRGEIDADGTIRYLGRGDAVLKIRGFRVEPAEVEDAITKADEVTEAAVIAVPGDDGELELTAVVTAGRAGVSPEAIRKQVADLLPLSMVPTTVLIRDSLPRTVNGKLDRAVLTEMVVAERRAAPSPAGQPEPAPASGTYERLRAIWATVLKTDRIAAGDDFFALGGTSISALGVISRVRKAFGVPVPLAVLFETPTLEALVKAVDDMTGDSR